MIPKSILFYRQTHGIGDVAMMMRSVELVRLKYPKAEIFVQCKYPDLIKDHPAIDSVLALTDETPDTDVLIDQSTVCGQYELQSENIAKPRQQIFCENAAQILEKAGLEGIEWDNQPQTLFVPHHLRQWSEIMVRNASKGKIPIGLFWQSAEPWRNWAPIKTLAQWLAKEYAVFCFDEKDKLESESMHQIVGYSLDKVLALVSRMLLVISLDTSGAHKAGGLDIPLLGIFGPTDPLIRIGIYSQATWVPIKCYQHPCWYKFCKRRPCLKRIKVKDVLIEVKRKLSARLNTSSNAMLSEGMERPGVRLSDHSVTPLPLTPRTALRKTENRNITVLMVSSWNVPCGIAEYTKTLIENMEQFACDVTVLPNDKLSACAVKFDIVHIQYEPGLFLPFKDKFFDFLVSCKKNKIIATTHHYDEWFEKVIEPLCDFVIVHSRDISESPKRKYFIQGCPVFLEQDKTPLREKYNLPQDAKILASFGFIMFWKNIIESFACLAPIIKQDKNIYLQLLHAKHPKAMNLGYTTEQSITETIKYHGIEEQVFVSHDFLSKKEINERLQASDLGFIAGKADSKGSSASNKEFIAARCPLILFKCSHFGDLEKGILFVEDDSIHHFTSVLLETLYNEKKLTLLKQEQKDNYEELNYEKIAEKHYEIYQTLLNRNHNIQRNAPGGQLLGINKQME